jgi:endonuclease-3
LWSGGGKMAPNKAEYDFRLMHAKLRSVLGNPAELHRTSPLAYTGNALEVLLATIITQATSDRNALQAWLRFKAFYTSPEQVLEDPEERLAEAIRPAGLERQRAKIIRKVLVAIRSELGEYSLDRITHTTDAAMDFLLSLPGVGAKTAACTMLFGLKLPVFPVDTHIHRIAIRMQWVTPHTDPKETQTRLNQLIPNHLFAELHILLLNLGRSYCRPCNPKCGSCPLGAECPQTRFESIEIFPPNSDKNLRK